MKLPPTGEDFAGALDRIAALESENRVLKAAIETVQKTAAKAVETAERAQARTVQEPPANPAPSNKPAWGF